MTDINFREISDALRNVELNGYDLVVGIADGGIIPATLVAYKIGCDLRIVKFNYRNNDNIPQHPDPVLLSTFTLPANIKSILLVDDVAISGKTLNALKKKLFKNQQVATLVFRGKADFVLFPEITTCVRWPWKL
jgi:hypoxanthine phosphoribosyltransferase